MFTFYHHHETHHHETSQATPVRSTSKHTVSTLWHRIAFTTCLIGSALLPFSASADTTKNTTALTAKQHAFVEATAKKFKLPKAYIEATLRKASLNSTVIERIQTPWEAKPWHKYYPIFIKESRIEAGAAFWKTHAETLARAEKTYGVPPEIIVAILGVETFFGKYKGKYSVLDALYSLGFHYPKRKGKSDRSQFFSSELGEFMQLAYTEKFDPSALKGSYAGAMGWGQFISSSYRHYAVDFDGDNIRDLFNNPVDAIGSVANYFAEHKWKAGEPVAYQVSISDADAKPIATTKPTLKHTVARIVQAGATLNADVELNQKAGLFLLEQPEHNEYWLGLNNFYTITRYNHSPLYAMAVFQLSQAIKARYTQ